ncbi:hypothetical protein [Actinocorallia longicatena]|uniref:PT repeat-containing protein n=1 Tax=Actinocorallia longicatena TaxID=111803 RepID=A0ABP6Q8J1_9ACTN
MKSLTKLLAVPAVAGSLLLAAACGGSDSGSGSGGTSGDDPMAAFTACLKENGVTMPDRGQGGAGGDGTRPTGRPSGQPTGRPSGQPSGRPSMSAEQQKAMQACASLRPDGGQGGPGQGGGPGGGGQPSSQPTG